LSSSYTFNTPSLLAPSFRSSWSSCRSVTAGSRRFWPFSSLVRDPPQFTQISLVLSFLCLALFFLFRVRVALLPNSALPIWQPSQVSSDAVSPPEPPFLSMFFLGLPRPVFLLLPSHRGFHLSSPLSLTFSTSSESGTISFSFRSPPFLLFIIVKPAPEFPVRPSPHLSLVFEFPGFRPRHARVPLPIVLTSAGSFAAYFMLLSSVPSVPLIIPKYSTETLMSSPPGPSAVDPERFSPWSLLGPQRIVSLWAIIPLAMALYPASVWRRFGLYPVVPPPKGHFLLLSPS